MRTYLEGTETPVTVRGNVHYAAPDPDPWPDAVWIVRKDVAWYIYGWETEPDSDTEWSGYEQKTGQLVCCMVGDDSLHVFDPEDVKTLDRAEYCGECGQVGCVHDGLDRSEG